MTVRQKKRKRSAIPKHAEGADLENTRASDSARVFSL